MKQNEFDMMTVDRLETLITCQRESTDLEVMLVKRLLRSQDEVEKAEYEESQAISDASSLQDQVDDLVSGMEEISELASDPEDKKEALDEIFKIADR